MKKTYQAPEVIESTVVLESIIANSAGFSQDPEFDGEAKDTRRQDHNDWENIWNN